MQNHVEDALSFHLGETAALLMLGKTQTNLQRGEVSHGIILARRIGKDFWDSVMWSWQSDVFCLQLSNWDRAWICKSKRTLFTNGLMTAMKYTHSAILSFSPYALLKLSTISLQYWGMVEIWGQNNQVNLDFWEQVVPHPSIEGFFFCWKKVQGI